MGCSVWPGGLVGRLLRTQAAQLVVDQRQQLASGVRIALLNSEAQDLGNVRHRISEYPSAKAACKQEQGCLGQFCIFLSP